MRAPEFWSRSDLASRLAVAALAPIGWCYGATVDWRARHQHAYRPQAKVICVGNLTAGGSGKTPVALTIADALAGRGLRPTLLTRGYGGRERGPLFVDLNVHTARDVGDEPLLLARACPVVVSRDRRLGAEFACAHGAGVILMDDGHQNFELEKDLSIVVVDAADPWGNGQMLPAGPLREPVSQGLKRAHVVALVGDGNPQLGRFAGPVLRVRLEPELGQAFAGQRVIAFAGIGQPRKFFATLDSLGAELVDAVGFADHHVYTASQIARLKSKARANSARLVTTEKDYVRLTAAERDGVDVIGVRAEFAQPAALALLLDTIGRAAIAARR